MNAPFTNECPTVTACCDTANCRYEADGRTFPCSGYSCSAAAEEVVDYCEDEYGGCAVASNGGEVTFSAPGRELGGAAIASLLGLMFLRRRRQQARKEQATK